MVMDLLDDDGLLNLQRRASRTDPDALVREERGRWQEMPDANSDLAAWDSKKATATDSCRLCDRTPRLHCNACQHSFCASHSWVMLGVCRECATEERVSRMNKKREAGDNWLDGA